MNQELQEALSQGLTQRAEFEQSLIMKAWSDEDFRQEMLTNPRAVYARETGHELPEDFSIEVIEETSGTIKMVLPKNPSPVTAEGELTDEALEAVAGGGWVVARRGEWAVAHR